MFKLLNSQKNWIFFTSIYQKKLYLFVTNIYEYKTWWKVRRLVDIFKLGILNKKSHNYYFNTPLNRQKTRSRSPKNWKINKQIKFFKFVFHSTVIRRLKISKNFILFDYINRLWFKQWKHEWLQIHWHWNKMKKFSKKQKVKINFPILKYKYVIRNFKTVNKKKQKFLKHFNLGISIFDYMIEVENAKKRNKKMVKKKYGKYFILKQKIKFRNKRKVVL